MALPSPEESQNQELEAISQLFSHLIKTVKWPPLSGPTDPDRERKAEEVNPEEQQIIQKLAELTTPEELAKAILASPPTVTALITKDQRKPPETTVLTPKIEIIPPSEEEREWAERSITLCPDLIPTEKYTRKLINACQNFLACPRIRDGFISHSFERSPWERAVLNALNLIEANDPQKRKWTRAFKDAWGSSKYVGSKRNSPFLWINIIADILSDKNAKPPPVLVQMKTIADRAIGEIQKLKKQEENPQSNYDQYIAEVDRVTNLLSQATIAILKGIESGKLESSEAIFD